VFCFLFLFLLILLQFFSVMKKVCPKRELNPWRLGDRWALNPLSHEDLLRLLSS
jgi:hypothetical protein